MMANMPAVCHFWRLTPAEYRALTLSEYQALLDYQNEWNAHNGR
jgi:hypothetical protein